MSIERLLQDRPMLHAWDDGTPASFATSPKVLHFIHDHTKPGMTTLETGSGYSTIAFALAGSKHICITPFTEESGRIKQYCNKIGLQPNITFLAASSDQILPDQNVIPAQLDFVFIDGAHRFPFACIDFHYTESKLPVGGIMGVDDIDMPSVKVLYDFIRREKEWELIEKIKGTAFFRRIKPTEPLMDWQAQQMNEAYKQRKLLISSIKRTVKKFLPIRS
ncbi:MAG: class I SAM-dependent methyltransferase [Saprospiraceae bacterium]